MNFFNRLVGLLRWGIGPLYDPCLPRTTQTQRKTRTNVHVLSEVRTQEPLVQAVEDITRPRQRGYCDQDWQYFIMKYAEVPILFYFLL
jgi:hypothetical protein